jgi:hypothetical protein
MSKPAFQKVVDRANPNKIKINLPAPSKTNAPKDDIDADAPPAKKARLGGGAFGGFNAMLPAPKKAAPAAGASAQGTFRGLGKGLGSGVSLRTGAMPAFSREPIEVPDYGVDEEAGSTATTEMVASGLPSTEPKPVVSEVKTVKSTTMFRPLSVANKKKKKVLPAGVSSAMLKKAPAVAGTTASPATEATPVAKPKVSLFSMAPTETPDFPDAPNSKDYEPLLHIPETSTYDSPEYTDETLAPPPHATSQSSTSTAPQTLSTIATDLNLTPHELRQLVGRNGSLASVPITTFNTDAEYAHNEQLRQQGESVQHHALKSIAGTGKNSLKSLVNVASSQKEALEEHFAAGRRNKKEGASKYGW